MLRIRQRQKQNRHAGVVKPEGICSGIVGSMGKAITTMTISLNRQLILITSRITDNYNLQINTIRWHRAAEWIKTFSAVSNSCRSQSKFPWLRSAPCRGRAADHTVSLSSEPTEQVPFPEVIKPPGFCSLHISITKQHYISPSPHQQPQSSTGHHTYYIEKNVHV